MKYMAKIIGAKRLRNKAFYVFGTRYSINKILLGKKNT